MAATSATPRIPKSPMAATLCAMRSLKLMDIDDRPLAWSSLRKAWTKCVKTTQIPSGIVDHVSWTQVETSGTSEKPNGSRELTDQPQGNRAAAAHEGGPNGRGGRLAGRESCNYWRLRRCRLRGRWIGRPLPASADRPGCPHQVRRCHELPCAG